VSNKMSAYYYSLTGGMGGLLGWFLACWVLDAMAANNASFTARTLVKGLIVGAFIGAALCGRERMITVGFAQGGARDGAIGLFAGAIAGAIAGVTGYYLFLSFGQNLFGRIIGYVLFGAIIGVGEGLKWLSSGKKRLIRGTLGGAVGGLLAALVYHAISINFSATIGDGIANVALGLLLGLIISTAFILSNMAVLHVIAAPRDKMVGQMLRLGGIGDTDTIGSDPNNSVPFITDAQLAPHHATIHINGREFSIEPLTGDPPQRPGLIYINNSTTALKQGVKHPLKAGDKIKAANCLFEFVLLSDRKVVHSDTGSQLPETATDAADILSHG